jgi:hypothetical protein
MTVVVYKIQYRWCAAAENKLETMTKKPMVGCWALKQIHYLLYLVWSLKRTQHFDHHLIDDKPSRIFLGKGVPNLFSQQLISPSRVKRLYG